MQVVIERNRQPELLKSLLPAEQIDLYQTAEAMSVIYDEWFSVSVIEGPNALTNSFRRNAINNSALFDVEPVLGYGGPAVAGDDPTFLARAIGAYSEACRSIGVVAELIRFNPVLEDHLPFLRQVGIEVRPAKEVVLLQTFMDETGLLAGFSSGKRKLVTRLRNRFSVRPLDKRTEMPLFRSIYEPSITRLGGASFWLFSDAFYDRLCATDRFEIIGVWSGDRLVATCLLGFHPPIAHYVLAANTEDYVEGASERLVFEAAMLSARRSSATLVLGGGVTDRADDGLLVYKKRFSQKAALFHIGKMIHDPISYAALKAEAFARKPQLESSQQLLVYRQA